MLKYSFQFKLNNNFTDSDTSILPIISITVSIVHFGIIALISLIIFLFPLMWLMFFMPLTVISLLLGAVPSYIQPYFPKINIILPLLALLRELNLLKFFIDLHSLVFYTITKVYLFFFIFCYGLTFLYMAISRYNFYYKIVLREEFSYAGAFIIGSLIFFSCCGSYLRMLINVSNIIVIVTRRYSPELLDPLLRIDPPDLPPGSQQKGIFNFSRNTFNNHYPPAPKATNWGHFGVVAAVGTLLLSGATYYHTARQTIAAERQTYEFKRQNDLEELSQGLINKEEYNKRHPKN